ncbi:MAG TPA: phosphotransferase, partial [Pirellulales bacterium]
MSETIRSAPLAVSTDELQDLLQAHLDERKGARVVNLVRRPSEYRSSYELDEIDAQIDDGSALELVWKQTGRSCLSADAINAKPEFLYDPLREIDAHRQFLASNELGTPACYGAIVDSNRDLYGVLLERVSGLNLSFIGDLSIWQEAARWLARLHDRFAALATAAVAPPHLLVHDRQFFRIWIDRALQFSRAAQSDVSRVGFHDLVQLARRYDTAVDRLIRLPKSLIHGEFFASNILVDERTSRPRICPVDWETAGIGPCSLDLAALVAGSWTDG